MVQSLAAHIIVNPPNDNIYEFFGIFKTNDDQNQEALNLENCLWANTKLATAKILGIVLYVGKETRTALNSKEPQSKMGRFDEEINENCKVMFGFMVIVSIIMETFNGF